MPCGDSGRRNFCQADPDGEWPPGTQAREKVSGTDLVIWAGCQRRGCLRWIKPCVRICGCWAALDAAVRAASDAVTPWLGRIASDSVSPSANDGQQGQCFLGRQDGGDGKRPRLVWAAARRPVTAPSAIARRGVLWPAFAGTMRQFVQVVPLENAVTPISPRQAATRI